MEDLKGRVAVVTGAASGIGRALTESFLEAGMKVAMAGINRERLMTARQQMPADDDHVLVVPTDVSKPDQVKTLARETLQKFGAVHVLCNNAGGGDSGRSSWEIPPQEWRWVFDVNVIFQQQSGAVARFPDVNPLNFSRPSGLNGKPCRIARGRPLNLKKILNDFVCGRSPGRKNVKFAVDRGKKMMLVR